MKEFPDYQKYKWFFTSSGKLVVGGKSSIQNDELLKRLKRSGEDFVVMHTSSPGSPFSAIIASESEVTLSDKEEAAIFTGCFSRAWKENKKTIQVDIFKPSQLYKTSLMKQGAWGVKGKVQKIAVELSLVLIKQEGKLRAVPEKTVRKKNEVLLRIKPGTIDKKAMLPKFQVVLPDGFSQEEILSALPAGGISITK